MAKWPYAEPAGTATAEKQIPLESPGATEDDGLMWSRKTYSRASFQNTRKSKVEEARGGTPDTQASGLTPSIISEFWNWQGCNFKQHHSPFIVLWCLGLSLWEETQQYLPASGSVTASPVSQTMAVLYSSVLEPLTVLLNCCTKPDAQRQGGQSDTYGEPGC